MLHNLVDQRCILRWMRCIGISKAGQLQTDKHPGEVNGMPQERWLGLRSCGQAPEKCTRRGPSVFQNLDECVRRPWHCRKAAQHCIARSTLEPPEIGEQIDVNKTLAGRVLRVILRGRNELQVNYLRGHALELNLCIIDNGSNLLNFVELFQQLAHLLALLLHRGWLHSTA